MRTVLALALVVPTAAAGPKPGDKGTPEFDKAAALVKQLGNARFAVREAAGKQLIEMGRVAIPALTAGSRSDDEEVRTRSLALLPQVKAIEWKRRADAFLADPAAHRDLPLLAEWEKLTGKPDAGSRKVYAEMLRTNGELMEQAAAGPKAATDAVKARCRTVLSEISAEQTQSKASLGNLAALFFVHRTVTEVPTWVPERREWDSDNPCHLLANPGLAEAWAAEDVGPAMRRLVTAWADSRPADDVPGNQWFCLAVYKSPFPEAIPVLSSLAKDPKVQSLNVRAVAIAALGKVSDPKAHAALIEMIDDPTPLNRNVPYRVGDQALATLIAADKGNPADFGLTVELTCRFKTAQRGEGVDVTLRTFPDEKSRSTGIEKWKAGTAKKDR